MSRLAQAVRGWRLALLLLPLSWPALADRQTVVNLRAADQPIADVIRALAAAAEVAVTIQPEVTGQVTVTVERQPFETALTLVAAALGYSWRLQDGRYVVGRFADPAADSSGLVSRIAPLRRYDPRALARAFGFLDPASLDEPPPPLDLRSLVPAGLAQPPEPAPGEGGLRLTGSPAAVAELTQVICRIDDQTALIRYELTVGAISPVMIAALPSGGEATVPELTAGTRRGTIARLVLRSEVEPLLKGGLTGYDLLAQVARPGFELVPVTLAQPGDGTRPATTATLIGRLDGEAVRFWFRQELDLSSEAAGDPLWFRANGLSLRPEQVLMLISSPLDERDPLPSLVVLLAAVRAAAVATPAN